MNTMSKMVLLKDIPVKCKKKKKLKKIVNLIQKSEDQEGVNSSGRSIRER